MGLKFDNRVAVVTGAGGGLGRSYALLLSSLGAKVVVNDLGGSLSGSKDGSARAADKVVDEIKRNGGHAVPNYDSVENGEAIIATAIKAFGRVDILINNAGILRDKSFAKMTEADWDLVIAVHLKGSFSCTKAAWPHMIKQKFGRIVNTASAAGLYGNFGQANYSAAKLALVGFSKSLAAEGAGKNVFSNVIVPLAGTRMTETILPKDVVDALRPEFVAPVVVYLCHDSCIDNGEVMECGAGWVAKVRWQRAKGITFAKGFTPEDVKRDWKAVGDFAKDFTYPTSLQESLMMVTQSLNTTPATEAVPTTECSASASSKAEKLFMLMGEYLKRGDGAAVVKQVGFKFFWDITEKKGGPVLFSWTIDLKNGSGEAKSGKSGTADATFTMTEDDFIKVCLGSMNPQIAFVQGKMKIAGNLSAATKFTPAVFPKITSDLLDLPVEAAINKYMGQTASSATKAASAVGASGISGSGLKCENILSMIEKHLSSPAGAGLTKVGHIYQFDISATKGATPVSFIIQLKNSPPFLKAGKESKADATFSMLDSDFSSLVQGKLSPQVAFMQGKMQIKGNMKAAMKFTPDLFPKMSSL